MNGQREKQDDEAICVHPETGIVTEEGSERSGLRLTGRGIGAGLSGRIDGESTDGSSNQNLRREERGATCEVKLVP